MRRPPKAVKDKVQTSEPPAQSADAIPIRIRHVDSLRALAAGLVMWSHLVQTLAPVAARDPAILGFLAGIPQAIDLGRTGVMVFFAVSGFVIFRSFDGTRKGAGRRFLIKRFCRLYPAYWVSMLSGMLIWTVNGQAMTSRVLAANATMAPGFFGQPMLLGVYWTLEIELAFYGLCLGLYWMRCLERRALLVALVAGLASLPRILRMIDRSSGTHLSLSIPNATFVLSLAVMFWGALFRMAYDETHGFRRGTLKNRSAWAVMAIALVLIDAPDPNLKWAVMGLRPGPLPGHASVVLAVVIFSLWVAWLRVDNPLMTYLGVISYSLYLFHPVVKLLMLRAIAPNGTFFDWNPPLSLCLLICASLTIVIAMLVYRWVERPAIVLGKRWCGKKPG